MENKYSKFNPGPEHLETRDVEFPNGDIVEITGRFINRKKNTLKQAEMRASIAALYAQNLSIPAICVEVSEYFGLETQLTVGQVNNHVQAMLKHWEEQGLIHIDKKNALILASLHQVETAAWDGFFASKEGKATYNYTRAIERIRSNKQEALRERALLTRIKDENPEVFSEDELNDIEEWALHGRTLEDIQEGDVPSKATEQLMETINEKIKEYRKFEESLAGDKGWLNIILDCIDKRAKVFGSYKKDNEQDNPELEYAKMDDKEKQERIVSIFQRKAAELGVAPTQGTHLAEAAPLGGGDDEEVKSLDEGQVE